VTRTLNATHGLTEGRRYPATPEVPQSSYEVVCKCRKVFVEHSWDLALDSYLDHHAEMSALDAESAAIADFVSRVEAAAGRGA
jgi:hypothetical protein